VLKQGFNVDPILQKAGRLHLDHDYNEYWQIIESGQLKADDLITFKYERRRCGDPGRRSLHARCDL